MIHWIYKYMSEDYPLHVHVVVMSSLLHVHVLELFKRIESKE